jgi:PIN domain nuclease of toxin-antitoxin system
MSLGQTERFSSRALDILSDTDTELSFSAISILEIAIKQALERRDFGIDATTIRQEFLAKAFRELPVNGLHAAFVATLPLVHKDPFDRLLVAQASIEGITLMTADEQIARYPGPILKI